MKVNELKKLLKNTGTKVRKVTQERGQDPFVLYERTYELTYKTFLSEESICNFFANQKIVAADTQDDPLFYVIRYWVHRNQIVPKEIAAPCNS